MNRTDKNYTWFGNLARFNCDMHKEVKNEKDIEWTWDRIRTRIRKEVEDGNGNTSKPD